METRILRRSALTDRYGRSRSSIYSDIQKGVWPSQIALGPRCVGWDLRECEAVIAARIAGRSDDEIRQLVARLKESRAHFDSSR